MLKNEGHAGRGRPVLSAPRHPTWDRPALTESGVERRTRAAWHNPSNTAGPPASSSTPARDIT